MRYRALFLLSALYGLASPDVVRENGNISTNELKALAQIEQSPPGDRTHQLIVPMSWRSSRH